MNKVGITVLLALLLACTNARAESAAAASFQRFDSALMALTQALRRIGEEKGRQDFARELRDAAMAHRGQSKKLLADRRIGEAHEEIERALVIVKTGIATLRSRETLVHSLNFADPAAEYRYELDRYQSYNLLIRLLQQKLDGDPARLEQMERFSREAARARAEAATRFADQRYEEAIRLQEDGNRMLLRAIRAGGIYVPG